MLLVGVAAAGVVVCCCAFVSTLFFSFGFTNFALAGLVTIAIAYDLMSFASTRYVWKPQFTYRYYNKTNNEEQQLTVTITKATT